MTCFFILPVAVVMCGCSLDYGEAMIEEEFSEEIPDTILIEFTHTVVEDDQVVVVLQAERAETYAKRHTTSLSGVRFYEYNDQGEIITEGRADRASFHTESQDAEIVGAITFHSVAEGMSIYAEHLFWEMENKILTSDPQESVRIDKEDGSFLEGKGFEADFRRKLIRLRDFRGRYAQEE